MISTLSQIKNNYIASIPNQMPVKALQSFVASAACIKVCGGDNTMAVRYGAISALTSIIEALSRPIISNLFSNRPKVGSILQLVIPHAILSTSLVTHFSPFTIVPFSFNFQAYEWMTAAKMSIFNNNWYENNIARVSL